MTSYYSDTTGGGPKQGQERRPSARAGQGRKVVVVEDDASTLALICTLLQLEGYQAVSMDNTPEIVDLLDGAGVDFLLCDDNMPGMRGAEVIATIRRQPQFDDLPIVLMSGMYFEESDWRNLGADGFLLKPFNRQDLLDALRDADNMAAAEE